MEMIKAIETEYKGYRFRSRLEARWAVFFDSLDMKWEYEVQGFDLGDGLKYLPDFKLYFGKTEVWIEVKPNNNLINETGKKKFYKFSFGKDALILVGNPWPWEYFFSDCFLRNDESKDQFLLPIQNSQFAVCTKCDETSIISPYAQYANAIGVRIACECIRMGSYWIHNGKKLCRSSKLDSAYLNARGARFEHGESGLRR